MMVHIPRLTQEYYKAGTRHAAPTPDLIKSEVDGDGKFDFEWRAHGSEIYEVTATGCIQGNDWRGMHVHCTCPSYDEQDLKTTETGWSILYVCKHLKAALDSVCDPEATRNNALGKKQRKKEEPQEKARKQEQIHQTKAQQDRELPGERERLEYGIFKRSNDEIVTLIKERMGTVDGLQALSNLFPPNIMPAKQTKWCNRCEREYDPQIPSDQVCRKEHPSDRVRDEWDGSKKSSSECEDCGKTFDLDGFHSCSKKKSDPTDQGPYCFQYPKHDHDDGGPNSKKQRS